MLDITALAAVQTISFGQVWDLFPLQEMLQVIKISFTCRELID